MEGTLKSNEENTDDTVEDKTENSEDSEVDHDVLIVVEGLGSVYAECTQRLVNIQFEVTCLLIFITALN